MAKVNEQKRTRKTMPTLVVKPLEPSTWIAFAQLVEENNGFTRTRQIAPHRWVVTKIVVASSTGEQS